MAGKSFIVFFPLKSGAFLFARLIVKHIRHIFQFPSVQLALKNMNDHTFEVNVNGYSSENIKTEVRI